VVEAGSSGLTEVGLLVFQRPAETGSVVGDSTMILWTYKRTYVGPAWDYLLLVMQRLACDVTESQVQWDLEA
jgi:hypothetical protein